VTIATDPAAWRRALPPDFRTGGWTAPDGWRLRRFDWAAADAAGGGAARGGLFFQAGRGDVFEKYLEAFGHWHARGWALAGFDWRGHGGSGRFDHAGGITSEFAPALADLAGQWREWAATVPGAKVLVGHSMGGFLSLRAVLDGLVAPDALVLVAPMLGLRSPVGARAGERLSAWLAGHPVVGVRRPPVDRARLLTGDPTRYADEDWWHARLPDHRLGPPGWAWLHEAFAATRTLRADPALSTLTVPTLMLVADRDRLVDARAARAVAARMPAAELVAFPDSAHEILREADPVRDRALATIDAFLDRAAA